MNTLKFTISTNENFSSVGSYRRGWTKGTVPATLSQQQIDKFNAEWGTMFGFISKQNPAYYLGNKTQTLIIEAI